MKKLLLSLLFVLCLGIVHAETIDLDSVEAGSLSTWNQYYSGYNPTATYQEITSPYDGSTALMASVYGVTTQYCDTKYITKEYDMEKTYNTDDTKLNAYLEFEYDGTYYNFPYFVVQLYDHEGTFVGQNVWYGNGIVGGYYQNLIATDLQSYTELSSDKGYFELDLEEVGKDVEYQTIKVGLYTYTCVGTNSIVVDELSLRKEGNDNPQEVPEFSVIAGTVALIGALGIFAFSRKRN